MSKQVKCTVNVPDMNNITFGGSYKVLSEDSSRYWIEDDMSNRRWYPKAMFTVIGEEDAQILPDEYQKQAYRTAAGMKKADLLANGAMGLCGETGEVVDIIKKHLYQGHELDKQHIKEELGDVMWYIAAICTSLEISMNDVMKGNVEKLLKRYPNGFDADRSINRDNK